MKNVLVLIMLAACGSKAPAPETANHVAPTAAVDDLCSVVDSVIAAAPQKFAGLTAKPADAAKAGVEPGPVNASWSASWTGSAPTRLEDMKKRVLACGFAKDLVGDGVPHATEKNSPPTAIDWTLPAKSVGVEIIAEGADGVVLSIVAQSAAM